MTPVVMAIGAFWAVVLIAGLSWLVAKAVRNERGTDALCIMTPDTIRYYIRRQDADVDKFEREQTAILNEHVKLAEDLEAYVLNLNIGISTWIEKSIKPAPIGAVVKLKCRHSTGLDQTVEIRALPRHYNDTDQAALLATFIRACRRIHHYPKDEKKE